MDDGSASVKESLQMLLLYSDRVTDLCLTPHFYPQSDTPDAFFARRTAAMDALHAAAEETKTVIPAFRLGAEVYYYNGISRSRDAERFVIEGTHLLLVEMPMDIWNSRMIDDLLSLDRERGIRPVLAHIDRYGFGRGENRKLFEYYLDNRGLVQVNCEALLSCLTRRRTLSMIRAHRIHFIGSDAHNMRDRRPNMEAALDLLTRPAMRDEADQLAWNENHYIQ